METITIDFLHPDLRPLLRWVATFVKSVLEIPSEPPAQVLDEPSEEIYAGFLPNVLKLLDEHDIDLPDMAGILREKMLRHCGECDRIHNLLEAMMNNETKFAIIGMLIAPTINLLSTKDSVEHAEVLEKLAAKVEQFAQEVEEYDRVAEQRNEL